MPIKWIENPAQLLKACGYSSYKIRKENLFNQSTLQNLRHERAVSFKDLATVCKLTQYPVDKLIYYAEEETD